MVSQLYHATVSTVHHMGTVETNAPRVYELIVENINYLWLLLIYDILVNKKKKYHVKKHFISASSFCVVMKKAESVSTVLSLPYCLFLGRFWSQSHHLSATSEMRGRGLKFAAPPVNSTPARELALF